MRGFTQSSYPACFPPSDEDYKTLFCLVFGRAKVVQIFGVYKYLQTVLYVIIISRPDARIRRPCGKCCK